MGPNEVTTWRSWKDSQVKRWDDHLHLVGEPNWNILYSQIGNLPQIGMKNDEHNKYLKPPPSHYKESPWSARQASSISRFLYAAKESGGGTSTPVGCGVCGAVSAVSSSISSFPVDEAPSGKEPGRHHFFVINLMVRLGSLGPGGLGFKKGTPT